MSADAAAGDLVLQVVSNRGFEPGQLCKLGSGKSVEHVLVDRLGSLYLTVPLKYDHLKNEAVKVIEAMAPEETVATWPLLGANTQVAVLSPMTPRQQAAVLAVLSPEQRASILERIPPEDILKRFDGEESTAAALAAMSPDTAAAVWPAMTPREHATVLASMSIEEQAAVLASIANAPAPPEVAPDASTKSVLAAVTRANKSPAAVQNTTSADQITRNADQLNWSDQRFSEWSKQQRTLQDRQKAEADAKSQLDLEKFKTVSSKEKARMWELSNSERLI